jgi:YVTN family beta-propeller protein
MLLFSCLGCRKTAPASPGFIYVSNGKSDTVTIIDTASFAPLRTLNVGKNPTGVTPNPVNSEVYVVNTDSGSVSVIDARSNQLVATMAVQRNPYLLSVTPDGTRAFVANAGSNTVTVLNLQNRQLLGNLPVPAQPGVARVSPDGKLVVVSSRGANAVSLIDAEARGAGHHCGLPEPGGHCHFGGQQQSLCGLHRIAPDCGHRPQKQTAADAAAGRRHSGQFDPETRRRRVVRVQLRGGYDLGYQHHVERGQ